MMLTQSLHIDVKYVYFISINLDSIYNSLKAISLHYSPINSNLNHSNIVLINCHLIV